MALNRSRVDVLCVPRDIDKVVDPNDWSAALLEWTQAGLLRADRPTARFVEGGAKGIRLDRPARRVVYGNQLGGFRVRCPQCGGGVARAFAAAMEAARDTGPLLASVVCASCGHGARLTEVVARPPIQIGRCAVVLTDVEGVSLSPAGRAAVEGLLGPMAVVLRRTS